jgi:hypothetical protein
MNLNNSINYKINEDKNSKKTIFISGADQVSTSPAEILFYDPDNGRYVKFVSMTKVNPVIVLTAYSTSIVKPPQVKDLIIEGDYIIGFNMITETSFIGGVMWNASGIGVKVIIPEP